MYTETKVIAYTENIPNGVVSVRPGLDEVTVQQVVEGLLDIASSQEGQDVLSDIYGIDALVPAEDSDYDIVRDYVTLYGIEFESCSQSTPVAEDTDGSLTFTNDQGRDTILQVPPGAVYQPTQVNISQILLPPNLPSDFNYTGDGFKLTAIVSGTTHSGSIQSAVDILSTYTLTVEFDGSGLSNAQESNLGLYCWQDGGWVKELSSHVDTTLNTILATPDHFSIWAVLGKDSFPIYLPLILTVP